jgi:hypothetical protein
MPSAADEDVPADPNRPGEDVHGRPAEPARLGLRAGFGAAFGFV